MRNITVSVPDEIYRAARTKAAEQDTSVSALVKRFLENLGAGEEDYQRREKLQAEVMASIECFDASDRMNRDEIHARRRQ